MARHGSWRKPDALSRTRILQCLPRRALHRAPRRRRRAKPVVADQRSRLSISAEMITALPHAFLERRRALCRPSDSEVSLVGDKYELVADRASVPLALFEGRVDALLLHSQRRCAAGDGQGSGKDEARHAGVHGFTAAKNRSSGSFARFALATGTPACRCFVGTRFRSSAISCCA